MREKELRLALVCYGGISLAVYMHGITKEIWRLARASRDFHDASPATGGSQGVYRTLLETIQADTGTKMRVLADIVAGASAGGINGIFLAQAIATGQSLEPLTDLWLACADVDRLLDPDARPGSKLSKIWAQPLVWMATGRKDGTVERTVDPDTQAEVKAKLSSFIRARWFEPPFGGPGFTTLLLDALDAMARSEAGPPLLPSSQPLDLFVTVTDFRGHAELLRLNSPPLVAETEHRLVIGFSNRARTAGSLGEPAELAFAARATASFPGAFPPFTVGELDGVLAGRKQPWAGRAAFLKRILPRHADPEQTVLIDGSVLANAPFKPAIDALRNRPARREIDRRFVYIDPKPGIRSIGITKAGEATLPGFFGTIFGALSDLPRTQPIRDNLESIDQRSTRIRRMREVVEALREEVEESIEALFGMTLFLDRPTTARLSGWRSKAQDKAARSAGHAYAAYGHLKLSAVIGEIAATLAQLGDGASSPPRADAIRGAMTGALQERGLVRIGSRGSGASEVAIAFFRDHDLNFRIRRLRFMARRLTEVAALDAMPRAPLDALRDAIYECLALYLDREIRDFFATPMVEAAQAVLAAPAAALDALAAARNLNAIDAMTDQRIAEALAELPKVERRIMLLTYLGFPYYDIATLPLLQGEGLEEFDPVKVDRISPDDAGAIRSGGADATLKGVQFNSFGAFFSRAFRENDYLWGRLHGADRLIDILLSSLPEGTALAEGTAHRMKHAAFVAILDEEEPRLATIPELFRELRREIEAKGG